MKVNYRSTVLDRVLTVADVPEDIVAAHEEARRRVCGRAKMTHTFTKLQWAEYRQAHAVADDPGASEADKAKASKTLRRLLKEREDRAIRNAARRNHGRKPDRENFNSDAAHAQAVAAWRDKIELDSCNRVLDDAASTVTARYRAKKTLEELEARLRHRGISPVAETTRDATNTKVPEPVEEHSDPNVAAFLASLGEPDEPAPKEPEVAVTPLAKPVVPPERFCERCQVSFAICGCDSVCDKCLVPRGRCYCPKAR